MPGVTVTGADAHHDAPLTNVAIKAFQSSEDFVGPRLAPAVPVSKKSDQYYIIDPDSWLGIANALRAPKTSPRRIEWEVSSDAYLVKNYALAGELALEDVANADAALRIRENTTEFVTEALLRDLEDRIARLVTSISNLGSGVALTGANKWSDYAGSDPISDVNTGHAFIRGKTGLVANTLLLDEDTFQTVRRHPILLDYYKYTRGGQLDAEQLQGVFRVQNILIGRGVKNQAPQAATASLVNIWGNIALLTHIEEGQSLQTRTFMLAFRWSPPELPAPMQVLRYNDPDPGKKIEVIEVGYYQDEKIVAKDLSYLINTTL